MNWPNSFHWLRAFLSLLFPGAGEGSLRQVVIAFLTWQAALLLGLLVFSWRPDRLVSLALLAVWLLATRIAIAYHAGSTPPQRASVAQIFAIVFSYIGLTVTFRVLLQRAVNSDFIPLRSYWIASDSNRPTLESNDSVIATTKIGEPRRGELCVFKRDGLDGTSSTVIKRIVALQGDRLEIRSGQLIVNGQPQREPYLAEPMQSDFPLHTVAPDHIFVMGDDRKNSEDSRNYGDVPMAARIARITLIYWSRHPSRLRAFP